MAHPSVHPAPKPSSLVALSHDPRSARRHAPFHTRVAPPRFIRASPRDRFISRRHGAVIPPVVTRPFLPPVVTRPFLPPVVTQRFVPRVARRPFLPPATVS